MNSTALIWIVMIAVMVASMIIQNRLKSRFAKYSEIPVAASGAEVAQRMLQAHGIHDVQIVSIEGTLTDHYNPQTKTVNLSRDVYYGRSVAAAAVAAHECGHVVQHATGYGPLRMRSALVPVVSNASARAVKWLEQDGIVSYDTRPMAVDALKWAAYTYVIAAIGSLATLLYYISMANRRS